jgi:hypothetical protein
VRFASFLSGEFTNMAVINQGRSLDKGQLFLKGNFSAFTSPKKNELENVNFLIDGRRCLIWDVRLGV